MEKLTQTERTTITRLAKRGSYEKETILEILREGLICHISFVHNGQPYILPNLYGVGDEKIYIHGSVGSFLQRSLMKQIDLCFSVTLVDGLVLARSAFHHSVNYRSVVLFGNATLVEDRDEKMKALEVLTNHVIKNRWEEVRWPNEKEMKQTMVLSIPITEASAKVRVGPPSDEEEDYQLDVWAGVLPLSLQAGVPLSDAKNKEGISVPGYVKSYNRSVNGY